MQPVVHEFSDKANAVSHLSSFVLLGSAFVDHMHIKEKL